MLSSERPYASPAEESAATDEADTRERVGGPLRYFAVAGAIGAFFAWPIVAPLSVSTKYDSSLTGYVIVAACIPIGALIFRIRSRNWPRDTRVRSRQRKACLATLLLPIVFAIGTGLRGQGVAMTMMAGLLAVVLIFAILLSGTRRRLKKSIAR